MPLNILQLEQRLLFDASIAGAIAGAVGAGEGGNTAPEIVHPETVIIPEETNLSFDGLEVLDVDVDPDVDILEVKVEVDIGTINLGTSPGVVQITEGQDGEASITFRGTLNNINTVLLSLTVNAVKDYVGDAVMSVEVSDMTDTSLACINLEYTPVNDTPTIDGIEFFVTLDQDQTYSFEGISIGDVDVDPDGEVLSVVLNVLNGDLHFGPAGAKFQSTSFTGTLNQINAQIDGLTYTPTAGFLGFDVFSIVVNDGGNSGTGVAEIASSSSVLFYTDIASPPEIAVPGDQLVEMGGELAFSTLLNNGISVDDLDSNILSLVLSSTQGILEFGVVDPGVTVIDADGDAYALVVGTLDALNGLLEGLTYTPNAEYVGPARIDVFAFDGVTLVQSMIQIDVVESGGEAPPGEDELENPNIPPRDVLLAQLRDSYGSSILEFQLSNARESILPWGYYGIDGDNQLTSYGDKIGFDDLVKQGDFVRRFGIFKDTPSLTHNMRDTGFGDAVDALENSLSYFSIANQSHEVGAEISSLGGLSASVELIEGSADVIGPTYTPPQFKSVD